MCGVGGSRLSNFSTNAGTGDIFPARCAMIRRLSLFLGSLVALVALVSIAPAPAVHAQAPEGWTRVTRIVDADTVDVSGGHRVRLFGFSSPEPGERCGNEATNRLRGFLTDHGRDFNVYLEYGPRRVDNFGRTLAYVWVHDGGDAWYLIDEWMVLTGFGTAWTGDGQYIPQITAAERQARAAGAGCLWAGQRTTAPPPATTAPSNCHPSYPTVCLPYPPDLDCGDIPHRRFPVRPPDPHRFDADGDGVGCESG
jgi:micrococcal nuclease